MLVSDDAVSALTVSGLRDGGIVVTTAIVRPGWPVMKTPTFSTRHHRAVNGRELRTSDQSIPVWEWQLSYPLLVDKYDTRGQGSFYKDIHGRDIFFQIDYLYDINHAPPGAFGSPLRAMMGFYNSVLGSSGEILLKDPTDNRTFEILGVGDGSQKVFQLIRTMGTLIEPITAPESVITVALNGVGMPGDTHSINYDIGTVTFNSPPGNGVQVTADFTYFFRCRFSDDTLDFENFMLDLWQLGRVKLKSIPK